MGAETAVQIETVVEASAAALLASAIAYCVAQAGFAAHFAAPAFALAFFAAFRALRRVPLEELQFSVPAFAVPPIVVEPQGELLLTDADRLQPPAGELILDDVLEEVAPDSRVVRLFDPSAMPTPGQLQERIDRHLGGLAEAPPDASQALHEALDELRRSLR
jgi:hypothetical protein